MLDGLRPCTHGAGRFLGPDPPFPGSLPKFAQGDGSNHDRLVTLANRVRHFHKDISDVSPPKGRGFHARTGMASHI